MANRKLYHREDDVALFRAKKPAGKPGEWFYCLVHQSVEEGPDCPAKDRFGPYPSRTEAEHAMETVARRNERWETDTRWRDGDAERPPDGQ